MKKQRGTRFKYALHRGPRQTAMLHELIQQKGLAPGRYALFFVTGDAEALPPSQPGDDIEATSGYVLAADGRVFFFEFGWEPNAGAVALTTWDDTVKPQPHWERTAEYRRAREQVGLA